MLIIKMLQVNQYVMCYWQTKKTAAISLISLRSPFNVLYSVLVSSLVSWSVSQSGYDDSLDIVGGQHGNCYDA